MFYSIVYIYVHIVRRLLEQIHFLNRGVIMLSTQMMELNKPLKDMFSYGTVAPFPTQTGKMMGERNHKVRHEDVQVLMQPAMKSIWRKVLEIDCHIRLRRCHFLLRKVTCGFYCAIRSARPFMWFHERRTKFMHRLGIKCVP
jgi:hypothetical protein